MSDKKSSVPNSESGSDLKRLSKIMSERGLCSRREADDLIVRGLVLVDGKIADQLGLKVSNNCQIELLHQAQKKIAESVTILLHKPIGYVSGQPEDNYEPAVRLITAENQDRIALDPTLDRKHFLGLAPAGRLDIDSQGLLIFTQNGAIAKKLIGENSEIEKEYLVRVRGKLSKESLKLLNFGLELDGKTLKPAVVDWINEDQLKFILKEGKKRQVRRMCELVGLQVLGLKRVRVGKIVLGKLPEGKWRFLRPSEEF